VPRLAPLSLPASIAALLCCTAGDASAYHKPRFATMKAYHAWQAKHRAERDRRARRHRQHRESRFTSRGVKPPPIVIYPRSRPNVRIVDEAFNALGVDPIWLMHPQEYEPLPLPTIPVDHVALAPIAITSSPPRRWPLSVALMVMLFSGALPVPLSRMMLARAVAHLVRE
jgi:hypothetical protein